MKCDFGCEIDTVLTCSMDRIPEDYYIDKMMQIATLSGDVIDVKHQVGVIKKTVETIQDEVKKEMPPVLELKICIIRCYVDLKLELEKDTVNQIAKDLFKKKKHLDVIEEIARPGIRRLCADQLLKRVLQLEEKGLKIFFDLLKKHCREGAQKLVEFKITDEDRSGFTQVSDSVEKVPQRIPNGLKFEQQDTELFQCQLKNTPEKIDEIADKLLSQFHIGICDHSEILNYSDQVKKPHALLGKLQSCHFDSHSELQSVLGSKLYKMWKNFKDDGSRQGLENQSFWHHLLQRIQIAREYLIRLFRDLRIDFMQTDRGSLILKFVTMDDFDVKLLTPEAVKSKILEMIKTVCPEYQDIFKEPVHLAIFFKPSSSTDRAMVNFYLETSAEKEACSCTKLGNHDRRYIVEELNPATLSKWLLDKLQLNEDTKTELQNLISSVDMPRRKKMKKLLSIVESLENGYESLEQFCEEHDTFVYDHVFKKHRQMMVDKNPDGSQQKEKEEGLQKLSCTWIDFTVGPKGK